MLQKFEVTFYLKKSLVFSLINYEFLRWRKPSKQISTESLSAFSDVFLRNARYV